MSKKPLIYLSDVVKWGQLRIVEFSFFKLLIHTWKNYVSYKEKLAAEDLNSVRDRQNITCELGQDLTFDRQSGFQRA